MYGATPDHPDGENIFYYLSIYNEPYVQPAEPADFPGGSQALEQGILRGLYRYSAAPGPAAADPAGPGGRGVPAGEAIATGTVLSSGQPAAGQAGRPRTRIPRRIRRHPRTPR